MKREIKMIVFFDLIIHTSIQNRLCQYFSLMVFLLICLLLLYSFFWYYSKKIKIIHIIMFSNLKIIYF